MNMDALPFNRSTDPFFSYIRSSTPAAHWSTAYWSQSESQMTTEGGIREKRRVASWAQSHSPLLFMWFKLVASMISALHLPSPL